MGPHLAWGIENGIVIPVGTIESRCPVIDKTDEMGTLSGYCLGESESTPSKTLPYPSYSLHQRPLCRRRFVTLQCNVQNLPVITFCFEEEKKKKKREKETRALRFVGMGLRRNGNSQRLRKGLTRNERTGSNARGKSVSNKRAAASFGHRRIALTKGRGQ